jgi:hypothetical protein
MPNHYMPISNLARKKRFQGNQIMIRTVFLITSLVAAGLTYADEIITAPVGSQAVKLAKPTKLALKAEKKSEAKPAMVKAPEYKVAEDEDPSCD